MRSFPAAIGDIAPAQQLPEVRRYDIPAGRGIVHVDPSGPATIIDGGAAGLVDLGAFGQLPDTNPIFYAGDLSTANLRSQAAAGASVVVTDSNRRRSFLPEFTQQDVGNTDRRG